MKKFMVLLLCSLLIGCTNVREEQLPVEPILEDKVEEVQETFYVDFQTEGERISTAVLAKSIKYNCPVEVVLSLISSESGKASTAELNKDTILSVNPRARSCKDCVGLIQCGQSALTDYNNANGTSYTMEDLLDIEINLEVGVWHYMRYYEQYPDWTTLYIIYNVGIGNFEKVNPYIFYGYDGKEYQWYRNRFFLLRGMYWPTESYAYSLRDPEPYRPKERFEKCLDIYTQLLTG